jgi:hypothetical protein
LLNRTTAELYRILKNASREHYPFHHPALPPLMEFTYKMQYKFDAVEEGEMNCTLGQLVTSDGKFRTNNTSNILYIRK